ncbi:hypothetical protein [Microbacterium sp. NPDC058345]|uniref:hypothetical protein n=1 Tax=Microbacterium sp. NPDC058345 TaxID=3346455 RepID=UPI00366406D2
MNGNRVLSETETGSPAVDRSAGVPGGRRDAAPERRKSLFQPGWPITFAFAGFPLWWLLGISSFVGHIAAVLLLLELLRRRRIRAPRSFGLWLLFLTWVAAGVLLLQVDAPLAAPVTSAGTYFTWLYRFGWYLSATIFMLYIGKMRDELSSQRIADSLSMFFLTIVAGGWMAILTPTLEFPSLLEVLLPRGIAQVDFVNFLIHPTVVQDYEASVAGHARPSAPFAYANFWGLNFACTLPFFILSWFGSAAGWRRRALGVPILLLAAVPAILSWNRGLWLAVIAMVALVAIRSAVRGHLKTLVVLVSATVVIVVGILMSPLGEVIQSRLDNPTSNSTRTQLATLTTDSVVAGSPLVGFGSTRDSATSFYSIAGGDRPTCPDCSPPAMGTQGQFWLVIFAQGVLGIIFFYGFLAIWFLRGLRTRSPVSTAALGALLAHIITMTVYDSLGIGTVVLMVAIGLLWREYDDTHPPGPATGGVYTLRGYYQLVRQNVPMIVSVAGIGAVLGVIVQLGIGNPAVARTSVIVPVESARQFPGFTTSLDTLNHVAQSEEVSRAITAAAGGDAGDLVVTATSNSRILNLSYTDTDVGSALAGVTAAADALLAAHRASLESERDAIVESLDTEYVSSLRSLATVDASLAALRESDADADVALLESTREAILAAGADAADDSARVGALTFEGGRAARPATARITYDPLIVKAVSGLMVGLLVGVMAARLRDMRVRRVGDLGDVSGALGIDVVGRIDAVIAQSLLVGRRDPERMDGLRALSDVVRRSSAAAVMTADDNPLTRRIANRLDAELVEARSQSVAAAHPAPGRGITPQVILVVSEETRFGILTWRVIRNRRIGLDVCGIILVTDLDHSRPHPTHRRLRHLSSRQERGAAHGTTSH